MSKRVKILVSALVVVLLLTVGITATVMAQEEEPTVTPEVGAKGLLLAKVAEILDISEGDLVDAFKQARQEMREEALIRRLDKAVEEGRFTQDEADEFKEWWGQKPEVLGPGLSACALGFPALRNHMFGGHRGWHGIRSPWLAE